ncbi:hypothetical protein LO771_29130 [Streptacidiphilus sp. ASG 303]|uniref:hypothetical protein n=1 Tax=Streptacidiphilus sp. ASG 303 TaxID=2896847 RepID=UPI001E33907A|nr:hypothetical protein [Streptacidiphilus sp. ASG 303]MCD0486337.1 hypothetical protein [Streptacidiphilus sp. ASG 303]
MSASLKPTGDDLIIEDLGQSALSFTDDPSNLICICVLCVAPDADRSAGGTAPAV